VGNSRNGNIGKEENMERWKNPEKGSKSGFFQKNGLIFWKVPTISGGSFCDGPNKPKRLSPFFFSSFPCAFYFSSS
jgi:hypothetical protein